MNENQRPAAPSPSPGLPWWAYFAAGALSGWLARGKLVWVVAGLGALWVLRETAATQARAAEVPPPPLPEKKAAPLSGNGSAALKAPASASTLEPVDSWLPSDFEAIKGPGEIPSA